MIFTTRKALTERIRELESDLARVTRERDLAREDRGRLRKNIRAAATALGLPHQMYVTTHGGGGSGGTTVLTGDGGGGRR